MIQWLGFMDPFCKIYFIVLAFLRYVELAVLKKYFLFALLKNQFNEKNHHFPNKRENANFSKLGHVIPQEINFDYQFNVVFIVKIPSNIQAKHLKLKKTKLQNYISFHEDKRKKLSWILLTRSAFEVINTSSASNFINN